jgi:hypothetical protein
VSPNTESRSGKRIGVAQEKRRNTEAKKKTMPGQARENNKNQEKKTGRSPSQTPRHDAAKIVFVR